MSAVTGSVGTPYGSEIGATGGASPYTVFLAAEANMLLALPPEPFE